MDDVKIHEGPTCSDAKKDCSIENEYSSSYTDSDTDSDSDDDNQLSGKYSRRCNEMKGLLIALLDAASDVQDEVRASISTAIFTLGRSKPYRVLLNVFNYLNNDRPKGFMQRICILQAVEELCREVGSNSTLSDHQVMELTPLIVNEMVKSKEVIPQIQLPCSEALVGLGRNHCFQVMDSLTSKFETSRLPHFFVLQTIGSLAVTNVYTMVPFIKGLLGPIQPMLRNLKNDDLKWAFAFVLARFCECISDYLANIDKAPDPLVKKDFYSSEINAAFDVVFNHWLSTKDTKLRVQVCDAIGQMSHIMDTSRLAELLPRLLPALVALYRGRHVEPYPVTCALAHVLDASLSTGRLTLEQYMDTLLQALFQQVCAMVDYSLPLTVKNHYEVLRCCDILAKCSPEPVVSFHLSRLAHSSDRIRASCLVVIKHLINASEFELAQRMADIQTGLRLLLYDSSVKVKKALTQVIVALAHRGYLIPNDSAVFIEFIVRQCCLPKDNTVKRGGTSTALSAAASSDSSLDSSDSHSVRAMCESVLHLLSTTVEPVFPLLWPHLLTYLKPQYGGARLIVLRCAAQLAWHARGMSPEPPAFSASTASAASASQSASAADAIVPAGDATASAALTAQLLVWAAAASEALDVSHHALRLLGGLVNQLNPALQPLWDEQLPVFQQKLSDFDKDEVQAEWEESILAFISESIVCAKNAEWTDQVERLGRLSPVRTNPVSVIPVRPCSPFSAPGPLTLRQLALLAGQSRAPFIYCSEPIGASHLAAAIGRLLMTSQQQSSASVSTGFSSCRQRALLMRCLAVCVCHQPDKQCVCSSLDTVFASTQHAVVVERQGCSQAFGQISTTHLDIVLAKLDQVARAELTKKPTGLLGLMKDTKGEAAQERMRATVALCYGRVARMAPGNLLPDRLEVPIYRDLQTLIASCKTEEVRSATVTACGQLATALIPPQKPHHHRRRHSSSTTSTMSVVERTVDGDGRGDSGDQGVLSAEARDHLLQFVLGCVHERMGETGSSAQPAAQNDASSMEGSSAAKYSSLLNVVTATNALSSLPPSLSTDQRCHLLSVLFHAVLPLRSPVPDDSQTALAFQLNEKVTAALHTLLNTLLGCEPVAACVLDDIIGVLLPWMTSSRSHERHNSVAMLQNAMQIYLSRLTESDRSRAATFGLGGQLLASLVPRCVDSCLTLRPVALTCVNTVLSVLALCEGGRAMDDVVLELRDQLLECEDDTIDKHLSPLAQMLSERVSSNQLSSYLDTLLLGVGDRVAGSALAAAVALTRLLQRRGLECYQRVPEILHGLYGTLANLTLSESTQEQVLVAVRTLAHHHSTAVCNVLLSYPLPYDDHVIACWRSTVADSGLAAALLSQLVDIISCSAPYDEQTDCSRSRSRDTMTSQPDDPLPLRIANVQPLAAVSALHHMFSVQSVAACCQSQQADLLVRLLATQAAYIGVYPPVQHSPTVSAVSTQQQQQQKQQPAHAFIPNRGAYKLSPFRIATDALLSFLRCNDLATLADSVATISDASVDGINQYAKLAMTYTRLCVQHCPRLVTQMVPLFSSHLSSMYDTQRTAAVSCYAQLVSHRGMSSVSLTETLINSLLSRLVDSSPVVRRICLLGLGNMRSLHTVTVADVNFSSLLNQLGATVMSALLAGLDDHTDPGESIPLQAMTSLTQLLPVTDRAHVQHTLIPITLRIRVYFESSNDALRASSFSLFGVCYDSCRLNVSDNSNDNGNDSGSVIGSTSLLDQYTEQTHNNLISLLLHVADPCTQVSAACKATLCKIGALLGATSIGEVFSSHLTESDAPPYSTFLAEIAKILVKELESNLGMYTMSLLVHLRSQWSEIKSAAAMFLALLMCNLRGRQRNLVRVQPVCCGLRQLLTDSDWNVRAQAARAISLLHDY